MPHCDSPGAVPPAFPFSPRSVLFASPSQLLHARMPPCHSMVSPPWSSTLGAARPRKARRAGVGARGRAVALPLLFPTLIFSTGPGWAVLHAY